MKSNASYEYSRDNYRQPSCWLSKNNYCIPHFHSSIEITYVLSGAIESLLDGRSYIGNPGDIIIAPSYTIHANQTITESSHSYVLTIPLSFIPTYKSILEKKNFSKLLYHSPGSDQELKHCLKEILGYTKEINEADNINIIKGYTYVFLGILIKEIGLVDIAMRKTTSLAQDILVYLQEHYLEPLSLEGISTRFGYSKSRFSHIFNDYFGCNINEYLNGLRCRYACELLEQKTNTITEIALASGFESIRTFYRSFRKQFGITPMKYYENTHIQS